MKFYAINPAMPPAWNLLKKTFLVMKLTTLLLILAFVQVSAKSYSQVTLKETNAPLEKIIKAIKAQTGYFFVYSDQELKTSPITVNIKNATIQQALDACFKNQLVDYKIVERNIILQSKEWPLPEKVKTVLNIPIRVNGKVTDTTNTPLPGATIKIKGQNTFATDAEGNFSFVAEIGTEVTVSFIGLTPFTFKVIDNPSFFTIVLHKGTSNLKEVVILNTGYQTLSKERATGSFDFINNKLINRSFSTDILSRINGVASGVLFNSPSVTGSRFSVRGISTIFANTDPLVVVDNFPYDGDINNINPNDVENITILKDAAASSIWGVRAGNGVVVITTKKGSRNQTPQISFTSNITLGNKPDQYFKPQLSSSEYIDVEKFLYDKGYYQSQIDNGYQIISPVIDLLNKKDHNLISSADADAQIQALRNQDIRGDLNKYLFQKSVNQQYYLNIKGGTEHEQYFISTGYDNNRSSSKSLGTNGRYTLNAKNTFFLLNDRLSVTTGVQLILGNSTNPSQAGTGQLYPYSRLVDPSGQPITVAYNYNPSYLKTNYGQLLDWSFNPIEELNNSKNDVKSNSNDINLTSEVSYRIFKGLKANLNYQYFKNNSGNTTLYRADSFFARNLQNSFAQIADDGSINYVIPPGGILNSSANDSKSQSMRTEISYDGDLASKHHLSAVAGWEFRNIDGTASNNGAYGYDPDTRSNVAVNYVQYYSNNPSAAFGGGYIPRGQGYSAFADRGISYYGNANYTYDQKYSVSASARKDESNLFGVKANQKGVPLWSAGLSWNVDKEDFFKNDWIKFLKLRATYGYQGNVDKTLSAFITAAGPSYDSYNRPFLDIVNPPNASLRWERIKQTNIAIDLATSRVSGTVEFYIKDGIDLIGFSPVALQTGISSFKGNTANTHGTGWDFTVNSKNIDNKFKWITGVNFSFNKNIVTKYVGIGTVLNNEGYVYGNINDVFQGYAYKGLFAYKWAGLDPKGQPQGILDGAISEDYFGISQSKNLNDIVYKGSAIPTKYGNLLNTFSYQNFELSFNVIFRLGYYFRRPSINYGSLFNGDYAQADYQQRWQKPGDELKTTVPAMFYPNDARSDKFYANSEVLVEKADNIRLGDISASYTISDFRKKMPFRSITLKGNVSNLGVIWKSTKYKVDPDSYAFPVPRTLSIGLNANF